MTIPFVDLRRQYDSIAGEITEAMAEVIGQTAFVGGRFVERFEGEFAAYCAAKYCIGVANGTDALELSLRALDVGPGDEVVTVPNTFIATAAAITAVGATPVFVDVDPDTYQMDTSLLPAAITPRTRAIIPVHLYGHPADLDPILAIADAHGLFVIEDACQAHGAYYRNRRVGAIGHVGCFSFYPGKNLGAYGDAGAVVTNSGVIAERIRQLADHGRIDKYRHAVVGRNSRLDGLQAAVLRVKLRHLDRWNAARRRVAAELTARLLGGPTIPPVVSPDVEPVFHLYVVRTEQREALQQALREAGIATGVHYPIPVHLQPAYATACQAAGIGPGSYPVAEQQARQILSLPIFPELRGEEIGHICEVIERVGSPVLV
ncbi:MAG: DegT/DnrJ/EryC1/StrS family aminotransferase [Actinomycetota bacterium]|nr:DegT/DnrJ/EryC1/StrS family aminotransferase [Actinomycetota bacterium]MDQ3898905.1 DegT/DnrJ/EryC1/StrS family aminotransferase [Actinomycetota bacterium]